MSDIDIYDEAIEHDGIYQATMGLLAMYTHHERPDIDLSWLHGYTAIQPFHIRNSYDISELYEHGLAIHDKEKKKLLGKYYTPRDVSMIMSQILLPHIKDRRVVDPCCGGGNLLMALLPMVDDPWYLITNNLLICDIDAIAIQITKTILSIAHAPRNAHVSDDDISSYTGDFLDAEVVISHNDVIIMNPPYGRTTDHAEYSTSSIHDMYTLFMEKTCASHAFVAITPQSFIGGGKFSLLRTLLSTKRRTDIIAYDNVPGHIFCGRKHGIFNTNTSNSVRAAITISVESNESQIRSTPLIRWKGTERDEALSIHHDILNGIPYHHGGKSPITKCPSTAQWILNISNNTCMRDIIASRHNAYVMYIPTTPRYYTSAGITQLQRSSLITLDFSDERSLAMAYIILNSSYAYAWWRIFDGGITLTRSLLMSVPIPNDLSYDDIIARYRYLKGRERKHITTKMNAGKINENIKWDGDVIHTNNMLLFPHQNESAIKALETFHASSILDISQYWING